MARNASENWVREIPSVLFGLRNCFRDDTGYSAAEMVYGTSIKMPGEFFEPPVKHTNYEKFMKTIQESIAKMTSVPKRQGYGRSIFVHPELNQCSHVFIRCDRLQKSLCPPYEGPFPVVKRMDKTFLIKIRGKDAYTIVGTIRSNKREIPEQIKNSRLRPVGNSYALF
ncbi:hypothetical protein ACJJTC_003393 [Scirpophaga incertulas]